MATLGQYNLEEMTEQEVFEASCTHLLEQSEKSLGGRYNDNCRYKGENDLCCAAAIFIQNYDKEMENKTWNALVSKYSQSTRHKPLVGRLQCIHDQNPNDMWMGVMKVVALDYQLDTAFLKPWSWDEETCKYIKKED